MSEDDRPAIACSLSPTEMAGRGEELTEIARTALIDRAREAGSVRLVFDHSEATEAALADLVRRERECCPFLDFRLDSRAGRLTLDIAAPSDAQAILDAIFERSVPATAAERVA